MLPSANDRQLDQSPYSFHLHGIRLTTIRLFRTCGQPRQNTCPRRHSYFVIGYSLAETDSFFRHRYALGSVGISPLRRFAIFNPDQSGETDLRFRTMLGPARSRATNTIHKSLLTRSTRLRSSFRPLPTSQSQKKSWDEYKRPLARPFCLELKLKYFFSEAIGDRCEFLRP
jgi:hypothetical protein